MGEGEKEEEEDNQGSCPTTCLKFWETLFYCCGSCMKNFCIPNLTKRTKEDCAVCNGINKNEFAWKEINKSAGTDKQGISKNKQQKTKPKQSHKNRKSNSHWASCLWSGTETGKESERGTDTNDEIRRVRVVSMLPLLLLSLSLPPTNCPPTVCLSSYQSTSSVRTPTRSASYMGQWDSVA